MACFFFSIYLGRMIASNYIRMLALSKTQILQNLHAKFSNIAELFSFFVCMIYYGPQENPLIITFPCLF